MMPFHADLHVHSLYSDGSFTPKELIAAAKEVGLSALSITDHDTLDAYPEAFEEAKRENFLIKQGIELSASFEGISVHILAYAFDLQSEALVKLCARHRERRRVRNQAILKRLKGLGISIEDPDFQLTGRPHIAQALVQKGVVATSAEAFLRFLGEGKRAYVQGEVISVEHTLQVIHRAGGLAFLAHPHLLPKRKRWLKRLLELPFDGIECYYARFPLSSAQPWLQLAQERHLLVSGGSDFHDAAKPYNRLGSSWIDEERFKAIFNNYTETTSRIGF